MRTKSIQLPFAATVVLWVGLAGSLVPEATAVCGSGQSTYWACTGECVPGQVNVLECWQYNGSNDSPTGKRKWLITNICG